MLIMYLLILSICMVAIILSIHNSDEIHQIVACLSGFITILCLFILTPPLLKGGLGLGFFAMAHKIIPVHKSFR